MSRKLIFIVFINMETYITHKCTQCEKEFKITKSNNSASKKSINRFCSLKCTGIFQRTKKKLKCTNCNKSFERNVSQMTKSKNAFCCQSCSTTYSNKHKKFGTNRSKLEIWLEDQLNNLYPDLDILFNNKETIGSELDIYVPSMKLGFELNGIFHYEPIFGEDKLKRVQENDSNKFHACQKQNISLCSIDTSQQKYFKEKSSKKYLTIITEIINQRTLLTS